MTYERFSEIWDALISKRAQPAGPPSATTITNGIKPNTAQALIAYARGQSGAFDEMQARLGPRQNFGKQRTALGSIEGRLETISSHDGFRIVIYDALSRRAVKCVVPQEKFSEAHKAFNRRVSVSGKINYDRNGQPISVNAFEIRVFKEVSELPTVESLRGILKDRPVPA